MKEHEFVFQKYVEYRKSQSKSVPTYNDAKKDKIKKALAKNTKDDLELLFDYLTNSKDDYVKFINGENDGNRFYGTLDNLFRVTKLKEKISRAKRWKEQQQKQIPAQDLFMPFIILEKEELNQHYEDEFLDYEEEQQKISFSNLQMSIFAQNTKDNEQK